MSTPPLDRETAAELRRTLDEIDEEVARIPPEQIERRLRDTYRCAGPPRPGQ